MENTKLSKRNINIEALRIVAMLMVVTLHCLGNGLLLGNPKINSYNLLLIRILDTLSSTANAIFLIITGYYLINKNFNVKKIILLWGKTIFYSLIIFIICLMLNQKTYLFDSIFPVMSGQYWFISAYIALYLLAPIINITLNKINKNQFKFLIATLLIMLGIIRILFNPAEIFSGAIMPICLIYSIGAYLRKYVEIKPKGQYLIKYILIAIIFTLLYIILKVITYNVDNKTLFNILFRILSTFREYNNILIVAMTILIFMKFKTITINSDLFSKIIIFISPSVFSIYLIHQNINIRYMWLNFGIMNYSDSILLIPYLLFLIISVFIVCLCIDLMRRGIYFTIKKIPIISKIINKVNELIDKLNLKINNFIL